MARNITDPQGYKRKRVVYWLTDPEKVEHDDLLARQRTLVRVDLIAIPVLIPEPERHANGTTIDG